MKRSLLMLTVVFAVTVAMGHGGVLAQDNQVSRVKMYFRTGQSDIISDYMYNRVSLEKLDAMFKPANIPDIESVSIDAFASPDGSLAQNVSLAEARAAAVRRYIIDNYPDFPLSRIQAGGTGVNWQLLRELVEEDEDTPERTAVLKILGKAQLDPATAKNSLMALGNGSWNYMLRNMFPQLRGVTVVVVEFKQPSAAKSAVEVVSRPTVIERQPVREQPVVADRGAPVVVQPFIMTDSMVTKPLFALKTNLLFDVLTALNVEVEVPIGERWSIAGEYIFPWWSFTKKQITLQTLSGNLEGRYWFGNREKHDVMTGWFAGVYGGGGYYDVEWKSKGYQGHFYSAGFTGGYAHKIGRNLRMEYSLGIGYFNTDYSEYRAFYCPDSGTRTLTCVDKGTRHWIGPTRVKVSLVWMLNKKYHVVKGGAR